MNELKLGKMTYRQLSMWFGLRPDNLTKNSKSKQKKLELLKKYADYHIEGRNLYIDKIYIPVYSSAYEIIEREFNNEWDRETKIDTCSRVGKAIYRKSKELQNQVMESTAKTYTNKVKRERYGRNYIKDDRGTCGRSEYVWMDEDNIHALPEDKLKKLRECAAEAYKTPSELIAAIDDDFNKGNLTKEQRDQAVGEIDTYDAYVKFVELVEEALGFFPDKKTLLIDESNAWKQEEENA